MVDQMIELRKALDDAGIEWWDDSNMHMDRTKFRAKNRLRSVINGRGSYGGYDYFTKKNYGLLELLATGVNNEEPVGFLTASSVMWYVANSVELVKNMSDYNWPKQPPIQGWQCPICGKVMSPTTPFCPCDGRGGTTITSTETGTADYQPPTCNTYSAVDDDNNFITNLCQRRNQ